MKTHTHTHTHIHTHTHTYIHTSTSTVLRTLNMHSHEYTQYNYIGTHTRKKKSHHLYTCIMSTCRHVQVYILKQSSSGGNCWKCNLGGISSSVLSVFFTDKFALSQSDARISVAYKICQWKILTKTLDEMPPQVYTFKIYKSVSNYWFYLQWWTFFGVLINYVLLKVNTNF